MFQKLEKKKKKKTNNFLSKRETILPKHAVLFSLTFSPSLVAQIPPFHLPEILKRINHAEMRSPASLAKPPNTETVMRFDQNCRPDIFQSSLLPSLFSFDEKRKGEREEAAI